MRARWMLAVALVVAPACGGGGDPIPEVIDGQPADAELVPDSSPDAEPTCFGDDRCYLCDPVELDQFLDHCTDAQCLPFDDVARLPLYNDGDLPPLPS